MDVINNRRSIRKFIDKPVEKEKIDSILRAAMQAPSSENEQPWEFIVVDQREMLDDLSNYSDYATAMKTAPVAIVLLANLEGLPSIEYWDQDLSAATQNVLLEIVAQGLGGVWLGVSPDVKCINYIKDYFDLPKNIIPFSVVPFGYSERENKFKDRYIKERVHYNKWK